MALNFDTAMVIPMPSDSPLFSLRVTLDSSDFVLTFDYSAREEVYYLTIADANGDVIVRGIKVVERWFLLGRVSDERRPKGELLATDSIGAGPPDLHAFGEGRRTLFVYIPLLAATGTGVAAPGGG